MITESFSFRTAIFDALCSRLDVDRDSADASAMIHEAYAEPEVTPRLPGNRNAVFRTVLREPGAEDRSCEYTPEPSGTGRHTQVVYTTLCYQPIIVCYGPDSGEYAHRIRSMLFPEDPAFPAGSSGTPGSARYRDRPSRSSCTGRGAPSGAGAPT